MTPRTRHAAYTAHAAADFSRVTDRPTDRLTDTANIGKNSLLLMHSMQPKNETRVRYRLRVLITVLVSKYGMAWWLNGRASAS